MNRCAACDGLGKVTDGTGGIVLCPSCGGRTEPLPPGVDPRSVTSEPVSHGPVNIWRCDRRHEVVRWDYSKTWVCPICRLEDEVDRLDRWIKARLEYDGAVAVNAPEPVRMQAYKRFVAANRRLRWGGLPDG